MRNKIFLSISILIFLFYIVQVNAAGAPGVGGTSPSVLITSPANGAIVSTSFLTVTGTSTNAGQVTITLNSGTEEVACTGVPPTCNTWSYNYVVLSPGSNTILAQAYGVNPGEVIAYSTRTVTYSASGPMVGVTSPYNGQVIGSTTVNVQGTSSNSNSVYLRTNQGPWQTACTGPCKAWGSGNVQPHLGSNTLEAQSRDSSTMPIANSAITSLSVVFAPFCTIKTSCGLDEFPLFSMYQDTDSHVREDVNGAYKVCCPSFVNNLTAYTSDTCGTGATANSQSKVIRMYGTYPALDAHAAIPSSVAPGYVSMCLGLQTGVTGNVVCTSRLNSCNLNEIGVVSLYQTEDSHVGGYENYTNKICCSLTICPTGFAWQLNLVSGVYECTPIFYTCFQRTISTDTIDQTKACKARWNPPANQSTNEYWNDALTPLTDDCFAQTSAGAGDNKQACCYENVFNDQEYGEYVDMAINRTTIV